MASYGSLLDNLTRDLSADALYKNRPNSASLVSPPPTTPSVEHYFSDPDTPVPFPTDPYDSVGIEAWNQQFRKKLSENPQYRDYFNNLGGDLGQIQKGVTLGPGVLPQGDHLPVENYPLLPPPPAKLVQEEDPVDRLLRSLREKELGIRNELSQFRQGYNQQLDEDLTRALADTGYRAGEARAQVGAGFADRGLSRSSFASEGINQINQGELEKKASIRQATEATRANLNTGIDSTLRGIERQREKLEIDKNLANLKAADEMGFDIDVQNLQQGFKNQLNQLELETRDQEFFDGLVGGVLGGAAKIFLSL